MTSATKRLLAVLSFLFIVQLGASIAPEDAKAEPFRCMNTEPLDNRPKGHLEPVIPFRPDQRTTV